MTYKYDCVPLEQAAKVRWELVPYMHARAYHIGCGPYRVLPHFIGVDDGGNLQDNRNTAIRIKDYGELSIFASGNADCVFSSFLLNYIPWEDVPGVLKEWARIIKPGGYLCLYLPNEEECPTLDMRWTANYSKVIQAMNSLPGGWDLVDYQRRNQGDEYGLFFAFKMGGKTRAYSHKLPKPAKTCAVVRYGAIGDAIQAASVFPWLKEQGYHITVYCQDNDGYKIIKHDPHVDRFIIQGRDEVPPELLGEFWTETAKKYDKWINLSESVEGTLLAVEGRPSFEWPNEVRARRMDVNYLEFIHSLAEVPRPFRQKFYPTQEEAFWAKGLLKRCGARNIMWSLAGSSVHKTWPHLDTILARIMLTYPDVHVILVGDDLAMLLEQGWLKLDEKTGKYEDAEPRIHCMAGKWTIRQSMSVALQCDLVIGTETGVLNAVGLEDVPKIVNLSHSSPEMLTKHWKNTVALQQPKGVGCPKSPCRQLHHNWNACMRHEETGTAMCQYMISPEMMWTAVRGILSPEAADRKVA